MFKAFVGAACYIPIRLMPIEYILMRDNEAIPQVPNTRSLP
jgi:hypothetical protein